MAMSFGVDADPLSNQNMVVSMKNGKIYSSLDDEGNGVGPEIIFLDDWMNPEGVLPDVGTPENPQPNPHSLTGMTLMIYESFKADVIKSCEASDIAFDKSEMFTDPEDGSQTPAYNPTDLTINHLVVENMKKTSKAKTIYDKKHLSFCISQGVVVHILSAMEIRGITTELIDDEVTAVVAFPIPLATVAPYPATGGTTGPGAAAGTITHKESAQTNSGLGLVL